MTLQKAILLLVVLMGILPILPLSITQASGTSVGLCAQPEEVQGDLLVVKITAEDLVEFDACNYNLIYDASVLDVAEILPGNVGGIAIPVSIWQESDSGVLTIVQNVPGTPGVSGSGYLAEVQFDVKTSLSKATAIRITNGVLGNRYAQEIPVTWGEDLELRAKSEPFTEVEPSEAKSPLWQWWVALLIGAFVLAQLTACAIIAVKVRRGSQ